jgi:Protein of unknown function (DUF3703)
MNKFHHAIAPHVRTEVQRSRNAEKSGDAQRAFLHLECAHVLGQASTFHHVYVHCLMLGWGMRRRSFKEICGQLLRIVGAATKTFVGLVPAGNTGGANISPFRKLPIDPELAKLIERAKAS